MQTDTPTQALKEKQPHRIENDDEGIRLLRQIFPDLSDEELIRVHYNNIHRSSLDIKNEEGEGKGNTFRKTNDSEMPCPTSRLGQRIWNETLSLRKNENELPNNSNEINTRHLPLQWQQPLLPDDFLRLPPDVAVIRLNELTGTSEYRIVKELESNVLREHHIQGSNNDTLFCHFEEANYYTVVLFRDSQVGLGMTLCEEANCVWVHSLVGRDGKRWYEYPLPPDAVGGPASEACVQPGDRVLGINGEAFIPLLQHQYDSTLSQRTTKNSILKQSVSAIQRSPNPVVIHLQGGPPRDMHPLAATSTTPFVENSSDQDTNSVHFAPEGQEIKEPSETLHAFATALRSRNLVRTMKDSLLVTRSLEQFTNRARQWESNASFRIDVRTHELKPHFDPRDLSLSSLSSQEVHILNDCSNGANSRLYTPSTPTLSSLTTPPDLSSSSLHGSDKRRQRDGYLGRLPALEQRDVFIPLIGVRKALCVRILNTFLEDNKLAYTIWVYDIESGREWFAPIRHLCDFTDLRAATLPLIPPSVPSIPFPATKWSIFGGGSSSEATESHGAREAKCRQLEHFLRALCTMIYREELHPNVAEIAIHVQSFLGCDTVLSMMDDQDLRLHTQVAMTDEFTHGTNEGGHTDLQMNHRLLLKRSIQRYTYRLFLMKSMENLVEKFVDVIKEKGPKIEEIQTLEADSRSALKERAMVELERIRAFLDQTQELIMEGCAEDFLSISKRREFHVLREFLDGRKGKIYFDRLMRESVREQIEIEVYVPLRSSVSRLLVNGWRHDDMEMQFKMQELKRRPQSAFRIPEDKQSPSGWASVSKILNEGVGRSTLPCAKLRAIVDAAKEIARVYETEHGNDDNTSNRQEENFGDEDETIRRPSSSSLGADDMLPIFIYCVVRAEMERPCALCVLLKTLCERTNRIGETGYYLASFEAALTYIQEVDLSEDRTLLMHPSSPVSLQNDIA